MPEHSRPATLPRRPQAGSTQTFLFPYSQVNPSLIHPDVVRGGESIAKACKLRKIPEVEGVEVRRGLLIVTITLLVPIP
jgi:hypothetical protein